MGGGSLSEGRDQQTGGHVTGRASEHRADIEGLRAIAVLGVMLYHFDFPYAKGGFTGVDVFFVISGFVITSSILADITRGRFSLTEFYWRRAFRIWPALLATIVATLVAAPFYLAPDRVVEASWSGAFAAIFASNFYFWSSAGYFDASAIVKPLLHTWSLAVEWQVYLLLPLLVLASQRLSRTAVALVAGGLIAASLAAGLALGRHYPDLVFYWMPFRIFEFGLGAALAYFPVTLGQRWREQMFVAGLGMILAGFVVITAQDRFPGVLTVLPCVGTALVIAAGAPRFTSRLLTNAPALLLGRISYSLYLVHWPIAIYWQQARGVIEGATDIGTLMALSLVLALLLHATIEKPMRYRGRIAGGGTPMLPRTALGASAAAAVGLSVLSASQIIDLGGLSNRPPIFRPGFVNQQKMRRNVAFAQRCGSQNASRCKVPVAGRRNVLIVGDSHAIDALNAYAHAFPDDNILTSFHGGCPPEAHAGKRLPFMRDGLEICDRLNAERFDPKSLVGIDVVVINVLLANGFRPMDLRPYLDFVHRNSAAKIVLMGNFMTLRMDASDRIQMLGRRESSIFNAIIATSFDGEDEFIELAREYGALFVSKKDAYCSPECELFANGVPFTWDKDHLSLEFAQKLGDHMRNPLTTFLELRTSDSSAPK